MFHKEGSVISSSSGSRHPKGTKAVDVPLRKSHRRQLRDRAVAYFLRNDHHDHHHDRHHHHAETSRTVNDDDDDETSTSMQSSSSSSSSSSIRAACDEIFLKGNLAARTLPDPKDVHNKAKTMVLYLKTPSSEHHHHVGVPPANNNNDNDSVCCFYWPYTTSTQFVWMSLEEKKEIIRETPTVALWAVMYPLVEMKYHAVVIPSVASKYLCRGADLMKAGILQIPQQQPQQKQQPQQPKKINKNKQHDDAPWEHAVAVLVRGNPQPFAVGMCHVTNTSSSGNTISFFGPGTKGLGVEIWNCYGDDLWRSSNTKQQRSGTTTINQHGGAAPYDNGQYGNVGFVDGTYVVPLIQHENDDDEDTHDSHNSEHDEHGTADDTVDNDDEQVPPTEEQPGGDNNNNNSSSSNNAETPMSSENDNTLSQPTEQDDSKRNSTNIVNNTTPSSSIDDDDDDNNKNDNSPDQILHRSFCRALAKLKNKDLPMSTGTFYAQHVLSNRPDGTVIDLKATSYKKFGNYLREMVSKGLVQVGPDNKTNKTNRANTDPMALLLSYNKRHDEIQSFSKSTTTSQQQRDNNNSTSKKLVLVSLKMVPNHWVSLLRLNPDDVKAIHTTSQERKGTGMLTVTEVRTMLETYINREGLVSSSNPGFVHLDGPLTDIIYHEKKKKQSSDGIVTTPPFEETMLSRKDLVKLYTNKHLPAYAMVEMPGNKIVKLSRGDPPKIQLEVSRRQSNKFVTRVRGLEEYGIDPHYFCQDVKQRLAVSATIDTDPTSSGHAALPKKGYVELVFGANIVQELEALLSGDESLSSHGGVKKSEHAVPKQVLDVVLKKGVPGRKKKIVCHPMHAWYAMHLPPTTLAHSICPIKSEALVRTCVPFNDPVDRIFLTIASGVHHPVSDTFLPTVKDLWVNRLHHTSLLSYSSRDAWDIFFNIPSIASNQFPLRSRSKMELADSEML
ncbi:translation initiation factor SUI1 [Nitzschia inconspicua]|uniref:Translation initiation factor SUI1 n=1 Tax=Nitzschia inconspicua TaxID=303405 RepID=A0A9K3KJL8_9STRA|nr:translation initiation factor SUI1 [Nitzschia inconspicua]